MGRRRGGKRQSRIITNPESVTPWWTPSAGFEPKKPQDRRGESAFFGEFSTESLFGNSLVTGGPQDPYEVLGLFPGASLAQVKRAHRNLAKQYHPDRFGQASDAERREAQHKMVQVNGAYAELLARVSPT